MILLPPGLLLLWLFAVWPPPVWYRTHWPAQTEFMRLSGQAGGKGLAPRTYRPVPLDSIAPAMAVAAVTAEDARFWVHSGIDWYELRHALGYRRGGFEWSSAPDRQAMWYALGSVPHRGG